MTIGISLAKRLRNLIEAKNFAVGVFDFHPGAGPSLPLLPTYLSY